MIRIDRLAKAIDNQTVSEQQIIEELKNLKSFDGKFLCRQEITKKSQMIRKELKNFEDRLQWHNDKYKLPDVWGKIIYKHMKYKDTKIIGSENFTELRPD